MKTANISPSEILPYMIFGQKIATLYNGYIPTDE